MSRTPAPSCQARASPPSMTDCRPLLTGAAPGAASQASAPLCRTCSRHAARTRRIPTPVNAYGIRTLPFIPAFGLLTTCLLTGEGSAKPRVMNPQDSIVSPKIGLKSTSKQQKQYKKRFIKAVFALPLAFLLFCFALCGCSACDYPSCELFCSVLFVHVIHNEPGENPTGC